MTHSALTDQIRESTTQRTARKARVDTFLIHHQAGTNDDAVIAGMQAYSGVSANYTISNEGRLTLVVNEDFRAWTSGSKTDGGKGAAWDHRSITVEIENAAGAPDWPISQAAIDKAAMLLNDLRRRYGITYVLGHRDLYDPVDPSENDPVSGASYATFCPGPGTRDRIIARAAELANPAAVEADKARVRRNATYLNTLGLAPYKSGAASDGIPIDPGDTNSRYYNLVQLWAASRGIWNDSFGAPYLTNTKAAERALDAFLDAQATPPPVVEPPVVEPPVVEEPEPEDPPIVEPEPEPTPDPEPEEPTVPKPPLINPDVEKLDEAVDVVTEQVAKYLPEEARGKVYDAVTFGGGIAAAVGVSALATAPAVGGEIGSVIAVVGAVATTIGTLAGVAAARLAKANKQDPVKTETLSLSVLSGSAPKR